MQDDRPVLSFPALSDMFIVLSTALEVLNVQVSVLAMEYVCVDSA